MSHKVAMQTSKYSTCPTLFPYQALILPPLLSSLSGTDPGPLTLRGLHVGRNKKESSCLKNYIGVSSKWFLTYGLLLGSRPISLLIASSVEFRSFWASSKDFCNICTAPAAILCTRCAQFRVVQFETRGQFSGTCRLAEH